MKFLEKGELLIWFKVPIYFYYKGEQMFACSAIGIDKSLSYTLMSSCVPYNNPFLENGPYLHINGLCVPCEI
jgi:hypothetical protein